MENEIEEIIRLAKERFMRCHFINSGMDGCVFRLSENTISSDNTIKIRDASRFQANDEILNLYKETEPKDITTEIMDINKGTWNENTKLIKNISPLKTYSAISP